MFFAPISTVRAQWSFDVSTACQRFAGDVLAPDPDQLIRAVDALAKALPVPESQTERVMLRDRLRIATASTAQQFHALFHRHIAHQCDYRWSTVRHAVNWDDLDLSSHRLLGDWASGYLAAFAESHVWPSALRAARVIRGSFEKPLDIVLIARTVGCGRSGLVRSFKDVYGLSMGEYHTRCRIVPAFRMLREPNSNVGAAAFRVGYQSTKNFYRALRELTGLTPSQVRELNDANAEAVLETRLRLPAPALLS